MIDWKKIKGIGIDLDGVVYLGDSLIDKADHTIRSFRDYGFKVFFLTNNSARSRASLIRKLRGLGIACEAEEILTSGFAAAAHLKSKSIDDVLVIGTKELSDEIAAAGLHLQDGNNPKAPSSVLVGFNPQFSYLDLTRAADAVRGGAHFVAANRDTTYPIAGGRLMPGCGPLVSAVENAGGRMADFIAGKPNPWMLQMVANQIDALPKQIVMIGDTPSSDILMAKTFGSHSVLIGKADTTIDFAPDLCVNSLDSVPDHF